jgi:hypothetical protein
MKQCNYSYIRALIVFTGCLSSNGCSGDFICDLADCEKGYGGPVLPVENGPLIALFTWDHVQDKSRLAVGGLLNVTALDSNHLRVTARASDTTVASVTSRGDDFAIIGLTAGTTDIIFSSASASTVLQVEVKAAVGITLDLPPRLLPAGAIASAFYLMPTVGFYLRDVTGGALVDESLQLSTLNAPAKVLSPVEVELPSVAGDYLLKWEGGAGEFEKPITIVTAPNNITSNLFTATTAGFDKQICFYALRGEQPVATSQWSFSNINGSLVVDTASRPNVNCVDYKGVGQMTANAGAFSQVVRLGE